jgi:50S ribosomal protein L16 3-hydroxylase
VEYTDRPRLADLVAPLSPEEFLTGPWASGRLHLARANSALVEQLKQIEALVSVEALLARHRRDVRVFGPDSSRALVPSSAALERLSDGHNLYITEVEKTVPEAHALLAELARDLAMAPWQLRVEAFAGRAGGLSSRHYDHDINFQIMLDGIKDWRLEENRNIRNPLQSFHPLVDERGTWSGLREEAYADDPDMPSGFDPERTVTLRAEPGTTVFLPRGWWHETRSLTDTWSINIVLRSTTWARAIARSIEIALHRRPELRAYCGGLAEAGAELPPGLRAHRLQAFAAAREAAHQALDEITADDAILSLQGFVDHSYSWTGAAEGRQVIEWGGAFFIHAQGDLADPLRIDRALVATAEKLCALREPFTWIHARSIGHDVNVVDLHRLLTRLVDSGLLELKVKS